MTKIKMIYRFLIKGLLCFIALILINGFLPSRAVTAVEKWELVIEKNDIKVYSRSIEGSNLRELKGIAVLDAKMEVIGEVLRDAQAFPQWMKNCKEARIIKKYDELNYIVYTALDMPWPTSDRDVVIRSSAAVEPNTGSLIINSRAVKEPLVPVRKGHVRMTELTQQFILNYIDRDRTMVIYKHIASSGGNIPIILVNFESKNYPYEILLGLRRMVKKEKYIESAKIFILKNKPLAVTMLKARVKKIITNKKIIEKIVNDSNLVEQILMTEGSEREIAKMILKVLLNDYITDRELIGKIINNDTLIEKMLMSKRPEEEILKIIVKVRLNDYITDIKLIEKIANDISSTIKVKEILAN